jgi:tetratricopeptide (TPR) repeat protein
VSPRAALATAGVFLAVVVVVVVSTAAVAQRRSTPPSPGVPPTPADPVREAFTHAIAPGLADTTQARLGDFLARYGRHPLARDAHHELGLLAYARGDYARARDEFRRARGPGSVEEARYWEGLAAFALGRTQEARTAVGPLARMRRAIPRRWDAAYLVALSWAQEGRRAEALAAYRELFALDGQGGAQAAALYQAIRLARELGHDDDVSTWRGRLLRTAPGSPEAASLLAEEKGARAVPDSAAMRAAARRAARAR